MSTFFKSLRTGAIALLMTAGFAQAELTEQDKTVIDGKSGLRVFTSDGAFLGITNGLRFFQGDRIRMFVVPKSGSMFRPKFDEINLTTFTNKVTRDGNTLILTATRQQVRNATPPPAFADDGPVPIALLSRR